jgi:hypothetical protein
MERRAQAATAILAGVDIAYVSQYSRDGESGDPVHFYARPNAATATAGYDWMVEVSAWDKTPKIAGDDSVSLSFDTAFSIAHVRVGTDSLAFDLGRFAVTLAGKEEVGRSDVPAEDLRLESSTRNRRGALALQSLSWQRTGDSLRVNSWQGKLLLGKGMGPPKATPAGH